MRLVRPTSFEALVAKDEASLERAQALSKRKRADWKAFARDEATGDGERERERERKMQKIVSDQRQRLEKASKTITFGKAHSGKQQ